MFATLCPNTHETSWPRSLESLLLVIYGHLATFNQVNNKVKQKSLLFLAQHLVMGSWNPQKPIPEKLFNANIGHGLYDIKSL